VKARPLSITTPNDFEIRMVRQFDAPRALVFDAFTQPQWLRLWLYGPDGWAFESCEVDLRVGGGYRYVWTHERDGKRMAAGGEFHELAAPVRVVATQRFDDAWYAGDSLNTLEFDESPRGVTTMTQTLRYQSRDVRDGVLRSGMERGLEAGYSRLDKLFENIDPAGDHA